MPNTKTPERTEHATPLATYVPPDELFDLTETEQADGQFAVDDVAGFWYATGRMDQGATPVVARRITGSTPSAADTAWLFGRLWARTQQAWCNTATSGSFPGMASAWENFHVSGGRTIQFPVVGVHHDASQK